MAAEKIHQALYDEALLWLSAGCDIQLNVAGTWLAVQELINDENGIVRCHTEMGALWFPLDELRAIREAEAGKAPASTWLP